MRAVALGGALLLGADQDVSDEEVKILVQILHQWFTDEPEAEIVTDREEIPPRLPESLAEDPQGRGASTTRRFILSRLTDVALADGALMDAESAVILDVAKQLEVPGKMAYADHGRRGPVDRVPDRREAEPHGGGDPPVADAGAQGGGAEERQNHVLAACEVHATSPIGYGSKPPDPARPEPRPRPRPQPLAPSP